MFTKSHPPELRDSPASLAYPGPQEVPLWSAWFGLLAGTLELAVSLLKCNLLDPRNSNASRHFLWLYPLAGTAVVGIPSLLLAIVTMLHPRFLLASSISKGAE